MQIDNHEIELKELKYLDIIDLSLIIDKKEYTKKLFLLSGLPEEDINNLSFREGQRIILEINKLNGLDEKNFQQPN